MIKLRISGKTGEICKFIHEIRNKGILLGRCSQLYKNTGEQNKPIQERIGRVYLDVYMGEVIKESLTSA